MRSRFLSVRLSPEEEAHIDELAARWGCCKADVLRWILRVFLMADDDEGSGIQKLPLSRGFSN